MKLRELLTASAAAIAFAGVASANELEGTISAEAFPVDVASEQTTNINNEAVVLNLYPSTGGSYLDSNQIIELSLDNGTFDGAVSVAGVAASTCLGNFSITAGGADGGSSVTILADNLSGCVDAANSIEFTFNLDVPNGDAVVATASVRTESAGTQLGGGAVTENLIAWENAFELSIDVDATPPEAQLPDFLALDSTDWGDVILDDAPGTQFDVAFVGDVNLASVAGEDLTLEVSGDFAGIEDLNAAVPAAGVIDLDLADTAGTYALTLDEDGTDAIIGGSYAAVATLDLGAGFSDVTASATLNIAREGTNILFADTLDDTLTQQFSAVNRYRISNRGSDATGAVSIQLVTSDNTPSVTGVQPLASSIPAGGDFVFFPAQVEAIFGAYGIGDFIVIVEEDAANLQSTYTQISNGGVTNFAVTELP